MRKLNITWDAATEKSATIDDIDPEAVKYFLNAAIREGRINKPARDLSIDQLLRMLHLISEENGQLTLAALGNAFSNTTAHLPLGISTENIKASSSFPWNNSFTGISFLSF